MYDIAIIGGGIVGAACAYTLSQYDISILMIEKENDVAVGETRANSAIIHAGFDPEPGTLMAALNVRGNAMTEKLCADLSVPFRRNGALVFAFTEEDRNILRRLLARGKENGVPNLRILAKEEIRAIEPEGIGRNHRSAVRTVVRNCQSLGIRDRTGGNCRLQRYGNCARIGSHGN